MDYPIRLQKDGETYLATSPDFPELTTFGDDKDDALLHAADALEEAVAARIAARDDVPLPSDRRMSKVALSSQVSAKVLLYLAMREKNWRKADLVRALHWKAPMVDRILDVRHASRMDALDEALRAVGKKLVIEVADAA